MELALRKDTVLQQDDHRCKLAVQGQICRLWRLCVGQLDQADRCLAWIA